MVIPEISREDNGRVKFISYDGKYPNLCTGVLRLRIDGEVVTFTESFWSSGGCVDCEFGCSQGEWMIEEAKLPDKYKVYVYEIDRVFNENVKWGHCGGCI